MTPDELKALFRAEVRDEATPYLWSDTEVYRFIDDAQKQFCRLTGGIADASSAVTQIAVTADDPWATYDSRILHLRDLYRVSDQQNVKIINFRDLSQGGDDYGMPTLVKFPDRTGPVSAAITNMEANKLRLVDTPVANDTLSAIVYRLPLVTVVSNATLLEIDELHHYHLLDWMKHLAHKKQDAETYDRGRSDEFARAFYEYCMQAKAERERREHKPRAVNYGGL